MFCVSPGFKSGHATDNQVDNSEVPTVSFSSDLKSALGKSSVCLFVRIVKFYSFTDDLVIVRPLSTLTDCNQIKI
jgi:hypothetical protein